MLGYIYQIRYALLLSLKRLSDTSDPDECNISIEKLAIQQNSINPVFQMYALFGRNAM